jgi:hypothetical protein
MSGRDTIIHQRFAAYLERRSLPRGLELGTNPELAERHALEACVRRYAPEEEKDVEPWMERLEIWIAENTESRSWPTENLIRIAARAITTSKPSGRVEDSRDGFIQSQISDAQAGQPIDEKMLYGSRSAQLIREIGMERVERYRANLKRELIKTYGEDFAKIHIENLCKK